MFLSLSREKRLIENTDYRGINTTEKLRCDESTQSVTNCMKDSKYFGASHVTVGGQIVVHNKKIL